MSLCLCAKSRTSLQLIFNIQEEATVPLLLFLRPRVAVRALSQGVEGVTCTCPGGETTPCLRHWRNFMCSPHLVETLSFLPIESRPTGRKELEIDGGRTERGSCSPSQAHTTGPTSLPKFKEKILAQLVSIANPARCLHHQIILLFSHLIAYFFPKAIYLFAIFAQFNPKSHAKTPSPLRLSP